MEQKKVRKPKAPKITGDPSVPQLDRAKRIVDLHNRHQASVAQARDEFGEAVAPNAAVQAIAAAVFDSPSGAAVVRCSTCGGALVFSAKTLGTAADSVCLVEIKPCVGCIDAKVNVIRGMM